ncbi:MAG: prepilin-type N-terminal cleavage/methylation domain-containing protein [Planctomycetota bacterium]
MTRRGLTLLELLIALTITSMIGLAMATTLVASARSVQSASEARSALQRFHALRQRVRGYTDPALAVLASNDQQGFALWLHDENASNSVNLSELRVVWYEPDTQRVTLERVEFPEDWDDAQVAAADTALADGADPFLAMESQRLLDQTTTLVLADGIASTRLLFDDQIDVRDSVRPRLEVEIEMGDEMVPMAFAAPLRDHRARP